MEATVRRVKKGFLKNKELYLDTVKYSERRYFNLVGSHGSIWNLANNSTNNGELVIDGNPIFSLIKKDSSKALRIVQDEPRSKKPYMYTWTEIFDKGKEGDNIPVLVISLELSNKTFMVSLIIVEQWFLNYEKNKFNKLLESVNKKFENNYVPSSRETAWELHDNLNKLNKFTGIDHGSSKSLQGSIKCLYNIHHSWDRHYSSAMTHVNKNLGAYHLYLRHVYTD